MMRRRLFLVSALTSAFTLGMSLIPKVTLRSSAQQSSFYEIPRNEARALARVASTSGYYNDFTAKLGTEFAPEKVAVVLGRGRDAFVVIPVAYQGNPAGGAFVARLNRRRQQLQEVMAWSIEGTSTRYHALVWQNSQLITDVILNDEGTISRGWSTQADGGRVDISGRNFVPQGQAAADSLAEALGIRSSNQSFLNYNVAYAQSLSCITDCLSANGIPLYLIGLVGAGCTLACIGTAGLGCYVCAAGVLGSYTGIGLGCLVACNFPVPT